jgi:hypothetical protein
VIVLTSEDLQSALRCLSWHSFLDFARLQGDQSHFSRIYHGICTECRFGLISGWRDSHSLLENERSTASLLMDLNEQGLRSILLAAHSAAEEQTELLLYVPFDTPDSNSNLLTLGRQWQQSVAVCQHNQLRVVAGNGIPARCYARDAMLPQHLRAVIGAMRSREISKIETGVFDANPLITRSIYARTGLVSDIPFGLLTRAYRQLHNTGLLRLRARLESYSS